MEDICLSHITAINYWRSLRLGLEPKPEPSRRITSLKLGASVSTLDRRLTGYRYPNCSATDVLVDDKSKTYKTKNYRFHSSVLDFKEKDLYRIEDGIYVTSPELCLLQLANEMKVLPLAEIVMEMCGNYTLYEGAERGFTTTPPITSTDKLRSFMSRAERRRGVSVLRKAVSFCEDNSASPRETELFLMLTLSVRRGGYGFPRPKVACKIVPSESMKFTHLQSYYLADFCWPEQMVVAEYDGERDHMNPESVVRDKVRRSALASMGYTVIVFTKEDVADMTRLDKRIAQLGHALAKRSYPPGNSSWERRSKLKAYLFNPSHHYLAEATRPFRSVSG